jgi:tetratricopeptide (TPR) repeat protein
MISLSVHGSEARKSPDALVQLALEAEDKGQLEEAIGFHKAVVEAQPTNVRSLNSIAGLYGTMGKFQEEVTWAKRATVADPKFAFAFINLGNGYAGLGEVNPAAKAFVAAIKINPKLAIGHYNLGVLHEQNGDVAGAEADYKNAIAADRGFEPAYLNLGALCANQKRFDDAIDWLQRLLKINPSANDARDMLHQIRSQRSGQ